MILAENVIDYGTAPEFNIGGISAIERISPGQVRVSFYGTYRGSDGRPERRMVAHHVWDWATWIKVHDTYAMARNLIEADVMLPLGVGPVMGH